MSHEYGSSPLFNFRTADLSKCVESKIGQSVRSETRDCYHETSFHMRNPDNDIWLSKAASGLDLKHFTLISLDLRSPFWTSKNKFVHWAMVLGSGKVTTFPFATAISKFDFDTSNGAVGIRESFNNCC